MPSLGSAILLKEPHTSLTRIQSSHGHEPGPTSNSENRKLLVELSYVSKPRRRLEAQVLAIPPPPRRQAPQNTHACCMCSTAPLPTVHTAKELRPGTPGSCMGHGHGMAWHTLVMCHSLSSSHASHDKTTDLLDGSSRSPGHGLFQHLVRLRVRRRISEKWHASLMNPIPSLSIVPLVSCPDHYEPHPSRHTPSLLKKDGIP